MTNHIVYTYNTVYNYAVQAQFKCIRFHRETLLFCSVSAYRLHVNEQNAPGKRISKWIVSKTRCERHRVNVKNGEMLLLIGMIM